MNVGELIEECTSIEEHLRITSKNKEGQIPYPIQYEMHEVAHLLYRCRFTTFCDQDNLKEMTSLYTKPTRIMTLSHI